VTWRTATVLSALSTSWVVGTWWRGARVGSTGWGARITVPVVAVWLVMRSTTEYASEHATKTATTRSVAGAARLLSARLLSTT